MYVKASTKEKRVFMFRMRCKMTSCHISRPLCVCLPACVRVCVCVPASGAGLYMYGCVTPNCQSRRSVRRPSSLRPWPPKSPVIPPAKGPRYKGKRQQLLDNRTFYLNFTHPHSRVEKNPAQWDKSKTNVLGQ